MCYGQTGAGKTFTQTGSTTDYKYRGIVNILIKILLYKILLKRYPELFQCYSKKFKADTNNK